MHCNVMSSYVLDTTGTTYTFYEISKRKETIRQETKTNRKMTIKKAAKTRKNTCKQRKTLYIYICFLIPFIIFAHLLSLLPISNSDPG